MSKDKIYGAGLFIIAIVVLLYYTYWVIVMPIFGDVLNLSWLFLGEEWAWRLPLWLAITVVLLIAAWIGWTMLTTPPPEPLEELEVEEITEEEEKKGEEKKEETTQ